MTLQAFLKDVGLPDIEVDAAGIKLTDIPGISDSFLSYQDIDQDTRSEKALAGTTIDRCCKDFQRLRDDIDQHQRKLS